MFEIGETYMTPYGLQAKILHEEKVRKFFLFPVTRLYGLLYADNGFAYVSLWHPKTGKAVHVATVKKDLHRFNLIPNPPAPTPRLKVVK